MRGVSLRGLFGRRAAVAAPVAERRAIFPPPLAPPPVDRGPFEAALALPDGTPADDALLAALAAEMHARRVATGTLDGPPSPVVTGLRIRKSNVPHWWTERGNLCLMGEDSLETELGQTLFAHPPRDTIAVIGSRSTVPRLGFGEPPSLIVFGDRTYFMGGGASATGTGTVLIGDGSTATYGPDISVTNGGIVLCGPNNMWAGFVTVATDDGHAVIDRATRRRINVHGGRVVIGSHVWLGAHSVIAGDTRIGDDCVIGRGSLVKGADFAEGTLAVGRPARPIRSGITWSREDVPPDATV